jgi:7-carboxy-7-deazaguanine synthase
MARSSIPVMEVYPALQGEGSRVGRPSVFVRTFGCNLRCWWCDTAYSINHAEAKKALTPEEYDNLYEDWDPKGLAERLLMHEYPDVVFTGGEPTIHTMKICEVAEYLRRAHVHTTVETNGTHLPSEEQYRKIDLWSLSPKLPGSQSTMYQERHARVNVDLWAWLASKYRGLQLKFVITEVEQDLASVQALLSGLQQLLNGTPVFLTPNGDFFEYDREVSQVAPGWATQDKITGLVSNDSWWRAFDIRILPQIHVLQHGRKRYV